MLLPRSNNACDWLANVTRRRDTQEKLYVTQRQRQTFVPKCVMLQFIFVYKIGIEKYRLGSGIGTGIKDFRTIPNPILGYEVQYSPSAE